MQSLKIAGIALAAIGGLSILGLVFYSYMFVPGGYRPPEISEVTANEHVIRTPQGLFVEKWADLNPTAVRADLGFLAPDFELIDFDGNSIRLSDYRGQPVLLNFWGTWCPPCRREMPDLQEFHELHGNQIKLIGINWADDLDNARDLLERESITYTNVIDSRGKAFLDYRLVKLPVSFWIDEQGIIRGIWQGAMTTENMVQGFEVTTTIFDEESGL